MLQQINRERNITEVCFYFESRKFTPPSFNTREDCETHVKTQNKHAIKQFEITCPSLNGVFVDILQELEYRFDCYDSNKYCHFIKLLQQRGFNVTPLYTNNIKGSTKAVKDSVLQWRSDHFTADKFEALNEILKVETVEDAEPFKDMYLEPFKLAQHFNVCTYLLKEGQQEASQETGDSRRFPDQEAPIGLQQDERAAEVRERH